MAKRKINKWLYLWIVQTWYPAYGWEDVCAADTFREARSDIRAYRENEPQYPHRLIKRRELNPDYTEQANG